jgi:hypothetical protein
LNKERSTRQRSRFLSFPLNRYSILIKRFKNKKETKRIISKSLLKDYRYATFFRKLALNVGKLPFKRRSRRVKSLVVTGTEKWRGVFKSRIRGRWARRGKRGTLKKRSTIKPLLLSTAGILLKGRKSTPEVTARFINTASRGQNFQLKKREYKKKGYKPAIIRRKKNSHKKSLDVSQKKSLGIGRQKQKGILKGQKKKK